MVGPNPNIGGVGSSTNTGPLPGKQKNKKAAPAQKATGKKDSFGKTGTTDRNTKVSQSAHDWYTAQELREFKEGIVTIIDPHTGEELKLRPDEVEATRQDIKKRTLAMLKLAGGGDPSARKSLLAGFKDDLSPDQLQQEINELEDLANADLSSLSINELEQLRKVGGKPAQGIDTLIARRKALVEMINRLDPTANVSETMDGTTLTGIHNELKAKTPDELSIIQETANQKIELKKAPAPEKPISDAVVYEQEEEESKPLTVGYQDKSQREIERKDLKKRGTA